MANKKIKLVSEIEMNFPDEWDDETIKDWVWRYSVHSGVNQVNMSNQKLIVDTYKENKNRLDIVEKYNILRSDIASKISNNTQIIIK